MEFLDLISYSNQNMDPIQINGNPPSFVLFFFFFGKLEILFYLIGANMTVIKGFLQIICKIYLSQVIDGCYEKNKSQAAFKNIMILHLLSLKAVYASVK